jgi:small subunit ribosomal protein S4
MARYTEAKAKKCRAYGMNLFESPKYDKILERRKYAPGEHGQGFRKKPGDYAIHLREKQKLRIMYGLLERQFRNLFEKAAKMKGIAGENLLMLLERRLDNVVFRMGFAVTRMQARQLVNHGHFLVNGRRVDIPSFLVRPGDTIEVCEKSRQLVPIINALDLRGGAYEWLEVDKDARKGRFLAIPDRQQIPVTIDERLIVEFYSK